MRGLKVVTADDSLTIFFKHPVDSNSFTESQMFATTRELIEKYREVPALWLRAVAVIFLMKLHLARN